VSAEVAAGVGIPTAENAQLGANIQTFGDEDGGHNHRDHCGLRRPLHGDGNGQVIAAAVMVARVALLGPVTETLASGLLTMYERNEWKPSTEGHLIQDPKPDLRRHLYSRAPSTCE
jgi:hypothetical protein